jgi:hypothetical protein
VSTGAQPGAAGTALSDSFCTVTLCISTLIGFGPLWELSFSKQMREVPAGVGCESH